MALGSQDYMSRHQQRNGQDEWEEREQKGDTELALKEDKKFARRKRRSAEEDFLKDYEPLQDASAEHLVESRPETKSRDSQRFSSKFETVADYVTVERKQKENWQNLHRWQESVDCRVDRLMVLLLLSPLCLQPITKTPHLHIIHMSRIQYVSLSFLTCTCLCRT